MDEKLFARALRTLVDCLPFDVWIRGADDTGLFANAAAQRRWKPLVGRTVETTEVQPDVADRWHSNNARALEGEVVEDEAVYMIDGVPRTFVCVVTPFSDETGIRGTVGMNVDVTGERSARAEALRLGRLASLGTLSASIGHEIGTSAAVALGELEMSTKLLEQGSLPDVVLPRLREAQRALIRAVGVLRDMRALAVGAALGSETCDVASAIATVRDVVDREIPKHVTFEHACPAGSSAAMSHSRLVQTLLNLIRNAIEALGAKEGTIRVEVTPLAGQRVRIDVVDDGPGIPLALRSKLFQPLVSTKEDGTGLGLYVCSLLASPANGTIEALSSDCGGTRMRVELPAAT